MQIFVSSAGTILGATTVTLELFLLFRFWL
jgi:hypothetical protein